MRQPCAPLRALRAVFAPRSTLRGTETAPRDRVRKPPGRRRDRPNRHTAPVAQQREEVFNIEVANLLQETGLPSTAETVQRSAAGTRLPDVLVDVLGLQVGIEAKFEDSPDAANVVIRQVREHRGESVRGRGRADLPGVNQVAWHSAEGPRERGAASRLLYSRAKKDASGTPSGACANSPMRFVLLARSW